ncbi:HD domain-containing protein [Ekhidna lutea]|uniref:HD domain-containing protein n=1 Tax=Ekhidna lutea TaxID=447679 RepID=UPI000B77DDAD|nr:HD domain-containing protein [Ekhidna lutea]
MDSSTIISRVKDYAIEVLSKKLPDNMTYHSINHTLDVVDSAEEIAAKQKIKGDDLEIIQIAAWFHDLGYAKGCENHEQNGANMAREFLSGLSYPPEKIEKIEGCIMATQIPQSPKNNLEKILCDADLMHLAHQDYFKKADLLHKEIETTKFCKIPENEWLRMNQEFLDKHCFFTEYARKNYEVAVKENLKKVRDRLKSWKKAKK